MALTSKKELLFDTTAFGGLAFFLFALAFAAIFLPSLALRLFISLLACFVVVVVVRLLRFRQRPDGSPVVVWYDRVTQSSFPSMHATRVASLCALVALALDRVEVWVLAVLVIVVTCATRVMLKRHYVSDVVVGVLCGALIAWGVWVLPL